MGCSIQNKTIDDENQAIQAAVEYMGLNEIPKEYQVNKIKHNSLPEQSVLLFSDEVEEDVYVVDLEVYKDRQPSNRVVLVSPTTYKIIGLVLAQ